MPGFFRDNNGFFPFFIKVRLTPMAYLGPFQRNPKHPINSPPHNFIF